MNDWKEKVFVDIFGIHQQIIMDSFECDENEKNHILISEVI